jgi:hypothetical protein
VPSMYLSVSNFSSAVTVNPMGGMGSPTVPPGSRGHPPQTAPAPPSPRQGRWGPHWRAQR